MLKGGAYVDIIAEILEADRHAEETLLRAENECRELRSGAESEKERLLASAENCRTELTKKADSAAEVKRSAAMEQIRADEERSLNKLEKSFSDNREQWAEEIFHRITSGRG